MATLNIFTESYPCLYELMLTILQANGGVNRTEKPRKYFLLTFDDIRVLFKGEMALANLTPEERLTLADGEESEQHAICQTSPWLNELYRLLNKWFEQGMP